MHENIGMIVVHDNQAQEPYSNVICGCYTNQSDFYGS